MQNEICENPIHENATSNEFEKYNRPSTIFFIFWRQLQKYFFLMSKTPCEFRYWQWLKCREFVTYVVQHWLGLNQMIVLRMSYDPFINIWFVIFPFTYLLGSYSWIIFCIFFKLKNCLSQMKIATQSMEEEFKATRYNRRYGGLLREQREKQFTMG